MRKKASFRSVLSIVLLMSLLLTLCACSRSERGSADGSSRGSARGERSEESQTSEKKAKKEEKAKEKEQEASSASPSSALAMTPETFSADKVLNNHKTLNASLSAAGSAARRAESARIYFENTKKLQRLFENNNFSEFSLGVRNIYSAVNRSFDNSQLSCFALSEQDGRTHWAPFAADDSARQKTQSRDFYTFDYNSSNYLALLFEDTSIAFGANSLNIVVSSFTEPGFDLSAFGQGLDRYMANNPQSAVCLYGALSSVDRLDLEVYRFNKALDEGDFTILNFSGKLPFFILAVGPEESVRSFDSAMNELMNSSSMTYRRGVFSNSAYTQLEARPLEMTLVPDPKLKSGTTELLQSYNTGALSEDQDGNIYYASYAGIETKDDRGSTANLSYSSRIACVSKDLDAAVGSFYTADFTLYAYDAETQSWLPCDKLASSRVTLDCRPLRGSSEEGSAILAAGDEQLYVSAKLDFSADSPLDRSTVYRVEVRLKLNYENPSPLSESNVGKIRDFCISDMDYYSALEHLTTSTGLNKPYIKTWDYSGEELKSNAGAALMRIPNLEALLSALEKTEHYAPEAADKIEYIDFIYTSTSR